MEKNFNNKIFYDSKILLELVEELKNNEADFNISTYNMCTFDSESIGYVDVYESFLIAFESMSNNEIKFTDIQININDTECDLDSSVLENFVLQDLGINGRIKLKKFNFGMLNRPVSIAFKINESPMSMDIESLCGWLDYKFLYNLNEKLHELNFDKYFWFSNCWEECTIIYASQYDIDRLNFEIEKNMKFIGYNPFSIK